jgi:hypothetical protein
MAAVAAKEPAGASFSSILTKCYSSRDAVNCLHHWSF